LVGVPQQVGDDAQGFLRIADVQVLATECDFPTARRRLQAEIKKCVGQIVVTQRLDLLWKDYERAFKAMVSGLRDPTVAWTPDQIAEAQRLAREWKPAAAKR
jgi:hypothetical protein